MNFSALDLRTDAIPPLIRRLALPASLGMLFSTLLTVVDTWYAGLLSATALAALSLAGPVFFLVMTLGIGIGQASNALVGNHLGADDEAAARRMALQAISFASLVSGVAAVIAWLSTPWLFALMGGEAPYLEPAIAYMNTVLLGTAFFALSIVINSILNTRGDTFSYRNAQMVAVVANIGLDPLFMFVFDFGVVGVAIATIIVQAGVVAWLLYKVLALDFLKSPALHEFLPHGKSYLELARQGAPNSASMLLVAVGSLIIVAYVTRFGAPAMAAYGIALRIEQLVLLLVIGINIAAISLTSVNYGAARLDRVREVYRTGLFYALGLMLVGAILILLFARQLLGIFTDDAAVLDVGITYLRFEAFILPAYALTFLSSAVLQGLKKPELALYFNIARQLVGQLLLFWIAIDLLEMDITGVWWSVLIINWVMALGIVVVVRRHLRRISRQTPGAPGPAVPIG